MALSWQGYGMPGGGGQKVRTAPGTERRGELLLRFHKIRVLKIDRLRRTGYVGINVGKNRYGKIKAN
jgi:hypothetical protein